MVRSESDTSDGSSNQRSRSTRGNQKSDAKDDKVIKAVEKIKQVGVKMLRDKEWREENGLILRDGKVYVPRDKKLRAEVIWLYHNTPVRGHGGQWKMTELVTRNFWWLGVMKEVKKYVESCDAYQKNKKLYRGTGRKINA